MKTQKDRKDEGLVTIDVHNTDPRLLEAFDRYVVKPFYPGGRSEALRTLMDQELTKRTRKYRFFNGRKFSIPKSCFILFALPRHEWQKLEQWIDRKQVPNILIAANGEVFLMNDAVLQKRVKRKAQKIESTAP